MQVAEILSDLTSLQVCDPSAALALVSTHPGPAKDDKNSLTNDGDKSSDDTDLKRAKDLLELHAVVKVAHQDGMDRDLERAREDVERIMRGLR